MSEPTPARVLEARSRAYGLMARLLLRGIDDVAWARIADIPDLWSGLEQIPGRDELAAEHHSTFHLGAFPYAGAFLSPDAQAGACSDRVRSHYAKAGFSPRLDEVSADHLGVMLAFLSFVTGAQADAREDGHDTLADRLDAVIAEFIETSISGWVPSLLAAIDALGSRFWTNVVAMVLGLVADHRRQLRHPHRPARLPAADSPLADDATGLPDIAEFLLKPALSGLFLTRNDIARLGRHHDIPRGFGSRSLLLTNLLRSAVDLGELPALLGTLDELLRTRARALDLLGDSFGLHGHIEPWRRRIHATRGLVLELKDHACHGAETGRPNLSTTAPPAP